MPKPISLGNAIDDSWADLVDGFDFDQDTKDLLVLEYARARDAKISQWARQAESIDGLTSASRAGVEQKRAETAARRAA